MTIKINQTKKAEIDAQLSAATITQQLDAMFDQLPPEKQKLYGSDLAAIFVHLSNGRLDRAKNHLELTEVPPEDAALKALMLSKFGE